MSITSLTFIVFVFATIIVYYLVPKRFQWMVLLAANAVFYMEAGFKAAIFVLITATSIYFAARMMDGILSKQRDQLAVGNSTLTKQEKKELRQKNQKRRRMIMILALLLNIGILCAVKYTHFLLEQVNALAALFGGKGIPDRLNLIVPLGISFYTFQSVGYLVDVYWEKTPAQTNYLKFLLFVSFFPQMTQGPISEYDDLSKQLLAEHTFTYRNYAYGMQRMIWGFAKKLLIANIMGEYVSNVFANYETYTGITTLLGAFCYSIQIYADFSGYMDIMCGLCEVLGIRLRENFDRPYFSKSIAEYWRRWHISLGDWFKKYIYYPIAVSKWNRNLGKKAKSKFGTHFGNTLPATIALLVVWTTTGLWHGASWGYVVWGLLNGAFIIFSLWMEPVYSNVKQRLKISDDNRLFRCFQIIRTFILVTFIKVLPEVGGLRRGLGLWKHIFTDHRIPGSLSQLLAFLSSGNTRYMWLLFACLGTLAMFIVSVLQSKYKVRDLFNKLPYAVRLAVLTIGCLLILSFGWLCLYNFGNGGFLYAGF